MEKNIKEVSNILKENSIYSDKIGTTQDKDLELDKEFKINLGELNLLSNYWFKNYFKENI